MTAAPDPPNDAVAFSAKAPGTPDSPEQEARAELVRRALKQWRAQLMSLDGRNNLVNFRPLKIGTLAIHGANASALSRFGQGYPVSMNQLFGGSVAGQASVDDAIKRIFTIQRKAKENLEERGVVTARVAAGIVSWTSRDGKPRNAPLLLQSITIQANDSSKSDFKIDTDPDAAPPELNPSLVQLIRVEGGATVPVDEINDAMRERSVTDGLISSAWQKLTPHMQALPPAEIRHELQVGNFSYAKLPMVADLEISEELAVEHDLIAALAGDEAARTALRMAGSDADERMPNFVPPADEFLVMDADSSQSFAINSVISGRNLVIQGPPGTGKSQTIANLIASLSARGKKTLFVAEKRAAIEAVTKRLDDVGLGHLVLDLHDVSASRKQVQESLRQSLMSARGSAPVTGSTSSFERSRESVIANDTVTHEVRQPWEVSVYELHDQLLRLANWSNQTRVSRDVVARLTPDVVGQYVEAVRAYVSAGPFSPEFKNSVWHDATIDSSEQAQDLLSDVRNLAASQIPNTRQAMARILSATGIAEPATLDGWQGVFELLEGVAQTLAVFQPSIFEQDLSVLCGSTAPSSWRKTNNVNQGWFERRRNRKLAKAHLLHPVDSETLHIQLMSAWHQSHSWSKLAASPNPIVPDGLAAAFDDYKATRARLLALGIILGDPTFDNDTIESIQERARNLSSDHLNLIKVPTLRRLRRELESDGLGSLITEFEAAQCDPLDAANETEYSLLASVLELLEATDERLQLTASTSLDQQVAAFQEADRDHIDGNAERVKRLVSERLYEVRDKYSSQDSFLQTEINKKRSLKPFRELVASASDLLFAYKPCWAMSPLVVSQTLPAERIFDVVIFDEASQVLPHDAVPALMRADQTVVAGDSRQLPPTAFFVGSEDVDVDDPEYVETADFESLLSTLAGTFNNRYLDWHYRSEDERLIAVSNTQIYDGRLVTFSGARGEDCIDFVFCELSQQARSDAQSATHEIDRVVDLMIEHAMNRPDESLGVVTLNVTHRNNIENALFRRIKDEPTEVAEWFNEDRSDAFFVKNIERVQGDERDAIILSTGYQLDGNGRLAQRFGPINQEGGERRLNVAASRSRKRMTLVSSFRTEHIDTKTSSRGRLMFHAFFQFMESGGSIVAQGPHGDVALNAFESDVFAHLRDAGLNVEPQWGVSGYRIDFAIRHPDLPGKFVLAVEADGASYHSSKTARDRDRLRQELLEKRGWRFHRIWSTAWFRDPDGETERVLESYQDALNADPKAPLDDDYDDDSWTDEDDGRVDEHVSHARPTPRPPVNRAQPIGTYNDRELHGLAVWIKSDGRLRTRDEMLEELRYELGYRRNGSKIASRLGSILDRMS